MNKNVLEKINENDSQIKKEFDHVNVDLTVQEFDEDYSHIENIEDFDEKTIKYFERMIRGSYESKEYIYKQLYRKYNCRCINTGLSRKQCNKE